MSIIIVGVGPAEFDGEFALSVFLRVTERLCVCNFWYVVTLTIWDVKNERNRIVVCNYRDNKANKKQLPIDVNPSRGQGLDAVHYRL